MPQSTVRQETTRQLTRTFAAPPDAVFRGWTDPNTLKGWWGPPGYATAMVELDRAIRDRDATASGRRGVLPRRRV